MNSETQNQFKAGIKKLSNLIQDIKVAMLTTVDPNGSLYSRPMIAQEIEEDGSLWFFTSKSSGKIHSIQSDQHVNLAYSSPPDSKYISVSGKAEVVVDKEKAAQLWSPMHRAWFPEGVNDPELVMIKVNVESAEYWDSPSGAVVQLFGFAKAMVTGEAYKGKDADNKRINLTH